MSEQYFLVRKLGLGKEVVGLSLSECHSVNPAFRAGFGINRTGPIRFLAGCLITMRHNQALSSV